MLLLCYGYCETDTESIAGTMQNTKRLISRIPAQCNAIVNSKLLTLQYDTLASLQVTLVDNGILKYTQNWSIQYLRLSLPTGTNLSGCTKYHPKMNALFYLSGLNLFQLLHLFVNRI